MVFIRKITDEILKKNSIAKAAFDSHMRAFVQRMAFKRWHHGISNL